MRSAWSPGTKCKADQNTVNLPPLLNQIEVRVLGALLEKDLATPEYYPLSLNALINACNQKSNRDPVVNYDDATVQAALERLKHKQRSGPGLRVEKYGHRLGDWNLGRRELALLCLLLLRGPQTPGELRARSERLYAFSDLAAVEHTLQNLLDRQPPLVVRLPRLPGTKEFRFAHLLSGPPETLTAAEPERQTPPQTLEAQLEELRSRLERLEAEFDSFRRQFQ